MSQKKLNMSINMTQLEFDAFVNGDKSLEANTIIRVTDTNTTYFSTGEIGGVSSSLSGGNVGFIYEFAGDIAPAGYLVCDGREVLRTDYPELFAVIRDLHGSGDGETTFNLPPRQGRVGVGLDTSDSGLAIVGAIGGEKEHTLTVEEMPTHHHNYYKSGSESVQNSSNLGADETAGSSSQTQTASSTNGGNSPHNNMQPYLVNNFIIKY